MNNIITFFVIFSFISACGIDNEYSISSLGNLNKNKSTSSEQSVDQEFLFTMKELISHQCFTNNDYESLKKTLNGSIANVISVNGKSVLYANRDEWSIYLNNRATTYNFWTGNVTGGSQATITTYCVGDNSPVTQTGSCFKRKPNATYEHLKTAFNKKTSEVVNVNGDNVQFAERDEWTIYKDNRKTTYNFWTGKVKKDGMQSDITEYCLGDNTNPVKPSGNGCFELEPNAPYEHLKTTLNKDISNIITVNTDDNVQFLYRDPWTIYNGKTTYNFWSGKVNKDGKESDISRYCNGDNSNPVKQTDNGCFELKPNASYEYLRATLNKDISNVVTVNIDDNVQFLKRDPWTIFDGKTTYNFWLGKVNKDGNESDISRYCNGDNSNPPPPPEPETPADMEIGDQQVDLKCALDSEDSDEHKKCKELTVKNTGSGELLCFVARDNTGDKVSASSHSRDILCDRKGIKTCVAVQQDTVIKLTHTGSDSCQLSAKSENASLNVGDSIVDLPCAIDDNNNSGKCETITIKNVGIGDQLCFTAASNTGDDVLVDGKPKIVCNNENETTCIHVENNEIIQLRNSGSDSCSLSAISSSDVSRRNSGSNNEDDGNQGPIDPPTPENPMQNADMNIVDSRVRLNCELDNYTYSEKCETITLKNSGTGSHLCFVADSNTGNSPVVDEINQPILCGNQGDETCVPVDRGSVITLRNSGSDSCQLFAESRDESGDNSSRPNRRADDYISGDKYKPICRLDTNIEAWSNCNEHTLANAGSGSHLCFEVSGTGDSPYIKETGQTILCEQYGQVTCVDAPLSEVMTIVAGGTDTCDLQVKSGDESEGVESPVIWGQMGLCTLFFGPTLKHAYWLGSDCTDYSFELTGENECILKTQTMDVSLGILIDDYVDRCNEDRVAPPSWSAGGDMQVCELDLPHLWPIPVQWVSLDCTDYSFELTNDNECVFKTTLGEDRHLAYLEDYEVEKCSENYVATSKVSCSFSHPHPLINLNASWEADYAEDCSKYEVITEDMRGQLRCVLKVDGRTKTSTIVYSGIYEDCSEDVSTFNGCIAPGDKIGLNDILVSNNGKYWLGYDENRDFVIKEKYSVDHRFFGTSKTINYNHDTSTDFAMLTQSGKFQLYDDNNRVSVIGRNAEPAAPETVKMCLSDEGYLSLFYDKSDGNLNYRTEFWTTRTSNFGSTSKSSFQSINGDIGVPDWNAVRTESGEGNNQELILRFRDRYDLTDANRTFGLGYDYGKYPHPLVMLEHYSAYLLCYKVSNSANPANDQEGFERVDVYWDRISPTKFTLSEEHGLSLTFKTGTMSALIQSQTFLGSDQTYYPNYCAVEIRADANPNVAVYRFAELEIRDNKWLYSIDGYLKNTSNPPVVNVSDAVMRSEEIKTQANFSAEEIYKMIEHEVLSQIRENYVDEQCEADADSLECVQSGVMIYRTKVTVDRPEPGNSDERGKLVNEYYCQDAATGGRILDGITDQKGNVVDSSSGCYDDQNQPKMESLSVSRAQNLPRKCSFSIGNIPKSGEDGEKDCLFEFKPFAEIPVSSGLNPLELHGQKNMTITYYRGADNLIYVWNTCGADESKLNEYGEAPLVCAYSQDLVKYASEQFSWLTQDAEKFTILRKVEEYVAMGGLMAIGASVVSAALIAKGWTVAAQWFANAMTHLGTGSSLAFGTLSAVNFSGYIQERSNCTNRLCELNTELNMADSIMDIVDLGLLPAGVGVSKLQNYRLKAKEVSVPSGRSSITLAQSERVPHVATFKALSRQNTDLYNRIIAIDDISIKRDLINYYINKSIDQDTELPSSLRNQSDEIDSILFSIEGRNAVSSWLYDLFGGSCKIPGT